MLPIDLEKTLDRIAWGKRFIKVRDGAGIQRLIILKSLDLRDRNFINFIYEEYLNEAIESGILTDTELKRELEVRSIWTQADEDKLKDLEEKVLKTHELLDAADSVRDKKRLERAVEFAKKRLLESRHERTLRFSVAAERYAETMKMYAIIFSMTYDSEENRLWKDWDAFLDGTDTALVSEIITQINKGRGANEREIRKLARSGVWRTLWSAGKSGNLFGKPIIQLDSEQHALVYWSQVYDSVYDAYERPADDIISDDDKLDKWFEEQAKKKEQEKKSKKPQNPLGLSNKIMKHGEVFVAVDQHIKPTNGGAIAPVSISEVAKLNSAETQDWKNRQFNRIKETKVITEKELRPRGDRESRGIIGATDAVVSKPHMKRGGRGATRDTLSKHPGGTL